MFIKPLFAVTFHIFPGLVLGKPKPDAGERSQEEVAELYSGSAFVSSQVQKVQARSKKIRTQLLSCSLSEELSAMIVAML